MILGLATDGASLTGTMRNFMPLLYDYSETIMQTVVQPVAYIILSFFFMLELYKISVKMDSMGGSTTLGAEMVIKVLFRMVLYKLLVDSISIVLQAIYEVSTYVTAGVAATGIGEEVTQTGIDTVAMEGAIDELSFWLGIVSLVLCLIVYLVCMVAVALSNVVITARFIELYVYLVIAPIPIATFPSEEYSQIGKSFLKSFAAVCIQGTLIFIVLTFLPYILLDAFLVSGAADVIGSLLGVLGYSVILILAVFSTGKWAKAICNAM